MVTDRKKQFVTISNKVLRAVALGDKHVTPVKPLRGFTLVELLVVVAVVGIMVGVGSDIFFSIMRAYNKATIITEIEQNGNLVINALSVELRSAKEIIPSSGVGITCLTIVAPDGTPTFYRFIPESGGPPPTANGYVSRVIGADCTSASNSPFTDENANNGVNVKGFSFTMRQNVSANTPPQVEVSLVITQPVGAPGRVDYQATKTFGTTVGLRTY